MAFVILVATLLLLDAFLKRRFRGHLTREEMVESLQPSPRWGGGDYFVYHRQSTTLLSAVSGVRTCWAWHKDSPLGTLTFLELAMRLNSGEVRYPSKSVKKEIRVIMNGGVRKGVRIPCFKYGDYVIHMGRLPGKDAPYDSYFAEDGNHRMLAYALLYLKDRSVAETPVDLYLGSLPYRSTYLMHLRVFRRIRRFLAVREAS